MLENNTLWGGTYPMAYIWEYPSPGRIRTTKTDVLHCKAWLIQKQSFKTFSQSDWFKTSASLSGLSFTTLFDQSIYTRRSRVGEGAFFIIIIIIFFFWGGGGLGLFGCIVFSKVLTLPPGQAKAKHDPPQKIT